MTRRGQAITVIMVVAGVVTALLLSAALLEGATNPWQGLFSATRGAQIWLRLAPDSHAAALRTKVAGVTGEAGPYRAAAATTVDRAGAKQPVELRAMSQRLPAIGQPLIEQGHWLTSTLPTGVVLESTFA